MVSWSTDFYAFYKNGWAMFYFHLDLEFLFDFEFELKYDQGLLITVTWHYQGDYRWITVA